MMLRALLPVLVLLPALVSSGRGAEPSLPDRTRAVEAAFEQQVAPLLKGYCLACHGRDKHKGDVDLSRLDRGSAALFDPGLARLALQKLLAREMPPERERQPTDDERRQAAAWLGALRRLAPKDPGESPIRRLSRQEYANTLHDLLGVDPALAAELPGDAVGAGFSSGIAPLLMEKYLLVADAALDQLIRPDQLQLQWAAGQMDAVVDGKPDPGRPDGAQRRLAGAGQLCAVFPAPVEGAYQIRVRAAAERVGREPLRLAVRCGNQVVGELKVTAAPKSPATYALTCRLPAGRTTLALIVANPVVEEPPPQRPAPGGPARPPPAAPGRAAKPPPAKPAADDPAAPALRTVVIDSIEITGPPAGPPSEAQRRLFVAAPGKDLPKRDAARRIAEAFARRAFRRPATAAELDVLLAVFDLADGQDEVFADAVKLMLKAALVSPQFLFISAETGGAGADGVAPVGDHQLAAKLSYLLWATMPDDQLAALADAGTLHRPAILDREVRRLIADPRSRAFVDGFSAQWLGLDRLDTLPVDERKFPMMTAELRRAMREEAALLFDAVLREERSLFDLLDADFTFLNAPLARIYGLEEAVKGAQMRRVRLDDRNRGGILAMPGVLAVTSLPGRTSPVKRGRWVLEQVFGQAAPTPPMNVATLEQQDTAENAALSLRQRTERHRRDPACAGCHRVLDPIGFGLENFDAIGRWRERDDTGQPVDAAGELPGRIAFARPQDLKRIIAARRDEVCRALVSKMLAYALCRPLDGYDEVVADDLAAAAAADGYRLQGVLARIATSFPFINRRSR